MLDWFKNIIHIEEDNEDVIRSSDNSSPYT